jgi:tetratricopeptide (TPR) repeat protein
MDVPELQLRAVLQQLELGQSRCAQPSPGVDLGLTSLDAVASHALGRRFMEIAELRAAATLFSDAIAASPANPGYHNDLGLALIAMNRPCLAYAAFQAGWTMDRAQESPQGHDLARRIEQGDAFLATASRQLELGDLDRAGASADRCLVELPDHLDALCLLARIALLRSDKRTSIALLTRALAEQPDYAPALRLLDQATAGLSIPVIVLPAWRYRAPRSLAPRPLVSLTIGTFNNERHVEAAVTSALAQTYRPLEIIITDDASTDATAGIIKACLACYHGPHRPRLIRHPRNLGSRGRGNWVDSYRRTRGRFIVQFSGDDVMYPDMIEQMVKVWLAQRATLVTVNARCIDGNSVPLGRTMRDPDAAPNTGLDALVRDGANDCCFGAGMGCDRELHETFPFTVNSPPGHLGTHDIMLPFHAGLLGGCSAIAQPLMDYRIHGQQFSLTAAHDHAPDDLRRRIIEERIWEGHLAHALFQKETLEALTRIANARFGPTAKRLEPALANQLYIMADRQVAARKRLFYEHGLSEMGPAQ